MPAFEWVHVQLHQQKGMISLSPPTICNSAHQRYLCSHCRKTWQLQFTYTASQPGTHQKIIDMAMNGVGCRASARIMGVGLNTILRHLKNSGRSR
ncbi:IS1-like element transposase [Klebsiella pneumoniae]